MKNHIALLLTVLAVTACSKQPPISIEEKALMTGFTNYYGALTYDEVCNKTDPKSRYDFKKKENVMLMGNQQLYAARLGGLMHVRKPDRSVDELVKDLIAVQQNIEARVRDILAKEGCNSEKAQGMAKAYRVYSTTHPAMISEVTDKSIIDQGGKVTAPEEVDAAGKPKS